VVVAGPRRSNIGKYGYPCTPDVTLDQVRADAFDALVIRVAGRRTGCGGSRPCSSWCVRSTRRKADRQLICHAGWVPISARILSGRQVTGVSAIKDDLENAGARFVDRSVGVDGNLMSSRSPTDLPDFCRALITAVRAAVPA
jgi:protease I